MRAPTDTIAAPMFPKEVQWANVAMLSMAKQAGRPVLLEFFDFCRVSSLRTLEYTKQWHARYAEEDLRVISVHCPGYPPSHDVEAVRAAVERLGIEHPVCIDQEFLMWRRFENQGWPARYLFDRRLRLFEYHYGEGAYAETEAAIQELLGVDRPLIEPLHPEDRPDAQIVVPTAEQPGAYSGPYEAGGVWVIAEGDGDLIVNGSPQAITDPGALQIVDHGVNTNSVLELDVPTGITVHATVFTPGVAARV